MRSFARTADKTAETAKRVLAALEQVAWYRGEDWLVYSVLVMVPVDRGYKDSDAGSLAGTIRHDWLHYMDSMDGGGYLQVPRASVCVVEAKGDLFVGIQNHAIDILQEDGVSFMVTLAPSAVRYFDEDTARATMEAFSSGAKIVSIAVPEDGIDEIVACGTGGGPIIAWDLHALIEAGGFNEAAAQPKIGEENPNAGVEEIHPIVNIMREHGTCYAVVKPHGEAIKKRKLEGEDLARHEQQIATKRVRQLVHAKSLGVDNLDFFKSHVMS